MLGLVIGVIGALSLSRLMQGLLFGVQPHDPVTLAGVSAVMAAVGLRRVLDSRAAGRANRSGDGDSGTVAYRCAKSLD